MHLRFFKEDPSPHLPEGYESISGDSPLGNVLFNRAPEQIEISLAGGLQYRVISVWSYDASKFVAAKAPLQANIIDDADRANHANGHLAREENSWGSFPKHDQYGDESNGEEHDYEDYPEYVANYSD